MADSGCPSSAGNTRARTLSPFFRSLMPFLVSQVKMSAYTFSTRVLSVTLMVETAPSLSLRVKVLFLTSTLSTTPRSTRKSGKVTTISSLGATITKGVSATVCFALGAGAESAAKAIAGARRIPQQKPVKRVLMRISSSLVDHLRNGTPPVTRASCSRWRSLSAMGPGRPSPTGLPL